MPELPEVQTIVSDLGRVLPGLKIQDVWSDWKKMIKHPRSFEKFSQELIGKKILKVRRRGKNILIELSGNKTLLIHQKMTGHMLYGSWKLEAGGWKSEMTGPLKNDPQNRFLHLVISLSNAKQLALSDLRKFAKVLLWPTAQLNELEDIKELGPEPLEKSFTLEKFKQALAGRRGKVKQVLMDQNVIAGIGNIYSDEILWQAGAHPLRGVNTLKQSQLKKIFQAMKKVLTKAVKAKGDSMSDYRRPSGRKGGYQKMQNAYHMEGKKCKKADGGVIKRIKIGSRSAHFCPKHQR